MQELVVQPFDGGEACRFEIRNWSPSCLHLCSGGNELLIYARAMEIPEPSSAWRKWLRLSRTKRRLLLDLPKFGVPERFRSKGVAGAVLSWYSQWASREHFPEAYEGVEVLTWSTTKTQSDSVKAFHRRYGEPYLKEINPNHGNIETQFRLVPHKRDFMAAARRVQVQSTEG